MPDQPARPDRWACPIHQNLTVGQDPGQESQEPPICRLCVLDGRETRMELRPDHFEYRLRPRQTGQSQEQRP